jgi:Ribonucleases G and E
MEKNLYIDASHPDETRIVLKSDKHIEEYEYENKNKLYLKNNIYLGKVTRIEPSLQAAFINYGKQRHGFLAFNDIQSDYYQIPHDDKERLKRDEENLRLQLKEKSKNSEDSEKSVTKNSENGNQIENLTSDEKPKDENIKQDNKTDQFNELKKRYGIRRYKIQEVIKPDQIILVQILKDERETKRCSFNNFYFFSW